MSRTVMSVGKTLRTPSDTDMLFNAATKPVDLFPRVARIDAILFTVQMHGKMCFLPTKGVQDDNSHD